MVDRMVYDPENETIPEDSRIHRRSADFARGVFYFPELVLALPSAIRKMNEQFEKGIYWATLSTAEQLGTCLGGLFFGIVAGILDVPEYVWENPEVLIFPAITNYLSFRWERYRSGLLEGEE